MESYKTNLFIISSEEMVCYFCERSRTKIYKTGSFERKAAVDAHARSVLGYMFYLLPCSSMCSVYAL